MTARNQLVGLALLVSGAACGPVDEDQADAGVASVPTDGAIAPDLDEQGARASKPRAVRPRRGGGGSSAAAGVSSSAASGSSGAAASASAAEASSYAAASASAGMPLSTGGSLSLMSSSAPATSAHSCVALAVCAPGTCGTFIGACGEVLECGGCPWPQTCGAVSPGACGGGGVITLQFSEVARLPLGLDPRGLALLERTDTQTRVVTTQSGAGDIATIQIALDGSALLQGTVPSPGLPLAAASSSGTLLVARANQGAVARHAAFATQPDAQPALVATAGGPRFVEVADLDHDGDLDAVVAHDSGVLAAVWNVESAAPVVERLAEEWGRLGGLTIADVDADGLLDVAYSLPDFDKVRVWHGAAGHAITDVPVRYDPGCLLLADLDDDGHVDLTVIHAFYSTLAVYPGAAGGSFGEPTLLGSGSVPLALVAGDWDADGRRDLAFTDAAGNLTVRSPALTAERTASPRVGTQPVALLSVDINRDGAADLVVLNGIGADLVVLQNTSH
ncbi:MAG: VCBS repeat-containing protein [Deltaproteobacteria bacterium]|nr:VCBS repeat-containing protein [Deltaproteobacteria bacterium]